MCSVVSPVDVAWFWDLLISHLEIDTFAPFVQLFSASVFFCFPSIYQFCNFQAFRVAPPMILIAGISQINYVVWARLEKKNHDGVIWQ